MVRKAVAKKPPPPRLRWVVSAPSRSPFGGRSVYQVRTLAVASAADEAVIAAFGKLMEEVMRRAATNVTKQRNIVLFAWDMIYSRLTVTYTDEDRSHDGRDVLKLACRGWDAEIQKLSVRKGLTKGARRADQIREWLEVVVQLEETAALLPAKLGVQFAFTTDVEGTSYDVI